MHRRRAAARGFVCVEVQATARDAGLIKAVAAALRTGSKAQGVRTRLANALSPGDARTAFDIFGSELPDDVFAGVFEQPREKRWRDIKL
jgi:hypothetical protein